MFKEYRDSVVTQLSAPLSLSDLVRHQALLARNFSEKRPKRPRQLKRLSKELLS